MHLALKKLGGREGKEGLNMSHDSRHAAVLCCAALLQSNPPRSFLIILNAAAAKLLLHIFCRSSSVL